MSIASNTLKQTLHTMIVRIHTTLISIKLYPIRKKVCSRLLKHLASLSPVVSIHHFIAVTRKQPHTNNKRFRVDEKLGKRT